MGNYVEEIMVVKKFKAEVLFTYQAQKDKHLTVNGKEIVIIQDVSSDLKWWLAVKDGGKSRGWIPASYARIISLKPNNNNNNNNASNDISNEANRKVMHKGNENKNKKKKEKKRRKEIIIY